MRAPAPLPIRIVTHNIRYATSSPFPGENPWPDRLPGLLNQLHYTTLHTPEAFICLQEALHPQLQDLLSGLNSRASQSSGDDNDGDKKKKKDTWSYIGIGREDGKEQGEYSPILYRPDIWELKHSDSIWLSKTPEKPSKGWDAASVRILTIGVFKHKVSRKIALALNTHLDDQGAKSRAEAAKIILKVVREIAVEGRMWVVNGVFLAGDLNSEESDGAYEALNGEESVLVDLRRLVEGAERYGNRNTFTGFQEGVKKTRIDFIHLGARKEGDDDDDDDGGDGDDDDDGDGEEARRKKEKKKIPWTVQGYSVLENRFDDGIYISDHRAVVGDVLLN
ncbi:MAG: hypothetical protein Q9227_007827 [Pyrenula ochraceoflavens]